MAKKQIKKHDAGFKARVALEAIKGQKTMAEITSIFGVHSSQIARWKKQVLSELPQIFASGKNARESTDDGLVAMLYQQIGQLKVELDWLKKNCEGLA